MKKKSRKKRVGVSLALIGVVSCIVILCSIQAYLSPTLQGKWQSDDSGETVIFLKDGKVKLEDPTQQATYQVISPNQMQYNIAGKTFCMEYYITNRTLEWGILGQELEIFNRR